MAILPFSDPLFDELLAPVPEDERRRSMHIVDTDGSITSAGDAVIRLMRVFPKSRPMSWAARLLPPLRSRIRSQYEDLAARRSELSEKAPEAEPTIVRPEWVQLPGRG